MQRAGIIVVTSIAFVFVATLILTVVEADRFGFMDIFFEVGSAFGTVGLSRGATGELDLIGRVTIMAVMFIGRVGPLTLGFLLATRAFPRIRYPSGSIHLG